MSIDAVRGSYRIVGHEPAMSARGCVRPLRTALLALVLAPAVACAQATEGDGGDSGLRITGVRPLTAEPAPFPMVEPFLAVNPRDPENLLVSVMSGSGEASAVYGSWDRGGDVAEGGKPRWPDLLRWRSPPGI